MVPSGPSNGGPQSLQCGGLFQAEADVLKDLSPGTGGQGGSGNEL